MESLEFKRDWELVRAAIQGNESHGEAWLKVDEDFVDISYELALGLDKSYKHASHAFLWARNDGKLWSYDLKASIMMQLRFDGHIGFPGGFIDPEDPTWEDGLNRELCEELNLQKETFQLNKTNYLFSNIDKLRMNVLHFYAKEFSMQDFNQIELDSMKSKDFGGEVMGIIRPPLYQTFRDRGFSIFIKNQFIGNALMQLLKAVVFLKIMNLEEIKIALK